MVDPRRLPACLSRPDSVFLILGIPFGLILLFLTPPFQIADEHSHFHHAYTLSQGQVFPHPSPESGFSASGGAMPVNVERVVWTLPFCGLPGYPDRKVQRGDLARLFEIPLNASEMKHVAYPVAVYAPPPYLAPALGIWVGRLLNLPPILLLYLGRLCCFAAWVGMTWGALRLMPVARWALLLLALFPLTLAQGAGLTADSFVLGLSFLFTATLLHYAWTPGLEVLRGRTYSVLLLLAVTLALSKQAYLPLSLLVFLIPRERFGAGRAYWGRLFLFFLLPFGIMLAWSVAVAPAMREWLPDVDPLRQAQVMLVHPIDFLRAVARTLKEEQSMTKLFGRLGWEDTRMPETLVWFYLLGMAESAWYDPAGRRIRPGHRLFLFGVLGVSVLVLAMLLYMQWNPVGNGAVRGLQRGRYYLPFMPLLFVAMAGWRPRARRWVPLFLFVALIAALILIARRYYAF
ncbi:MAG TPA: DUF2142 domain-containing protein [Candidatus Sumerlaeota bacterium]|nr:DUF2142 domain-containing protein [Candidatus Sumerlaeota bacterium]